MRFGSILIYYSTCIDSYSARTRNQTLLYRTTSMNQFTKIEGEQQLIRVLR
jgi:hypothetical protein